MKLIKLLFIVLVIEQLSFASMQGQENDSWFLGAGINVVDNSGRRLTDLFDVQNWNFSNLLKLSVEKKIHYDYGILLSFTINKFAKGKRINGTIISDDINYTSIDLMAKNYTTNYFLDIRRSWFEGCVIAGWGFNFFDDKLMNTFNIGGEINIKLSYTTSIGLQSVGKFSVNNNLNGENHFQNSILFRLML